MDTGRGIAIDQIVCDNEIRPREIQTVIKVIMMPVITDDVAINDSSKHIAKDPLMFIVVNPVPPDNRVMDAIEPHAGRSAVADFKALYRDIADGCLCYIPIRGYRHFFSALNENPVRRRGRCAIDNRGFAGSIEKLNVRFTDPDIPGFVVHPAADIDRVAFA